MRTFFLLILLVGLGAGFAYPWAVTNFSGHDIGSWRVYDRGGDFQPVKTQFSASDGPVRVLVDMTARAAPEFAPRSTVLTVVASNAKGTVLAEPVTFVEAKPQERNPQMRERIYRDDAGVISDIEDGEYSFVVARGDAEGIEMQSVDLVLRGGATVLDPRLQPVGFAMLAVGFIGLVLAMRRSRRKRGSEQPSPPRWGRGDGDVA